MHTFCDGGIPVIWATLQVHRWWFGAHDSDWSELKIPVIPQVGLKPIKNP